MPAVEHPQSRITRSKGKAVRMIAPIIERGTVAPTIKGIPDHGSYVSDLINEPWTRDARHCWRLVCEVQRDLFGRALPDVLHTAPIGGAGRRVKADLFGGHPERALWRETAPINGAVALMRRSAAQEQFFIHAGVFLDLDRGGVLHTDHPHGVVFDNLIQLKFRSWVPTFFIPKA